MLASPVRPVGTVRPFCLRGNEESDTKCRRGCDPRVETAVPVTHSLPAGNQSD
jgi:hypothetical protein